jgi:CheY-like chemotaxis protein
MDPENAAERKRILLSDDERDLLHAMQLYFEGEGYEVRGEPDVLAAVELARSWQPHLTITDLFKPSPTTRLGGIELIERLKADDRTKHIPVVVVSAGANLPSSRQQALDAGACKLVTKPFDPVALLPLVERTLSQ